MATGFLLTSTIWAIGSALAVAAIGAMSLLGGKARPRGAFAFGLFALLWGVQIALGNSVVVLAKTGLADTAYLLFVACSLPVTYLLVEFAASQAPPSRARSWRAARFAAAGIALLAALLLALAPGLLVGASRGGVPTRGPLFVELVIVPQFVAFALALLALQQAKRAATTPRIAVRAGILLAGLGVYVGFTAGWQLAHYVGALSLFPHPDNAPLAALFVALSLVVLAVAWRLLRDARLMTRPDDTRRERLLALALLVPFAWGLLEGALSLDVFPLLATVGLWRLVGVGVLAYGLARWRLFDLPQRTARAAASAGGAAAAVAGGATAYGAGTLVTTSLVVPALAGLVVVAATLVPGVRLMRRVVERTTSVAPSGPDAALYGQRLDAYRAALEASIARGSENEDAEFLTALRERFGIDESEHRVLLHYARSSVLVSTERSATAAFERLRLLGEGGAGRTWLARDRLRDRLVVLKEPLERWQRDPAVREIVMREARMTAKVRHPHVVTIEEVVEEKGVPILVMEYCEGGSLADLLRRTGPMPWRDAVRLGVRILRGVEAVHQAGIVHRDVKPSNVLLTGDGTPKVADFGIAIPASSAKTVIEGSTTFAGTLLYVAPEVRAGAVGDRASDVYSCAALLHECLTGSPPGLGAPMPEDVPGEVRAILAGALSPHPERRPATARGLAEELTRLGSV